MEKCSSLRHTYPNKIMDRWLNWPYEHFLAGGVNSIIGGSLDFNTFLTVIGWKLGTDLVARAGYPWAFYYPTDDSSLPLNNNVIWIWAAAVSKLLDYPSSPTSFVHSCFDNNSISFVTNLYSSASLQWCVVIKFPIINQRMRPLSLPTR